MLKKKPQRMCVSCRTKADKKDLLRIVLLPSGEVEYDPTGRKAGRGSYLCKKSECIMIELKAHRLSKGLRSNVGEDNLKKVAEEILAECKKFEAENSEGE